MSESDNFGWLLKARALNQKLMLDLYRFARINKEWLSGKTIERSVFSLLVGASFSLWRAAFLSDTRRQWPTIISDSEKLLERLLRDNAVAYPQDRETREWMAGYYINNAIWRLFLAWKQFKSKDRPPRALQKLDAFEKRGAEQESPILLWDTSHAALRQLLKLLVQHARRTSKR